MPTAKETIDASQKAFQYGAWSKIAPILGGGNLYPVEASSIEIFNILDRNSGIDAWQIRNDNKIIGLATRCQWTHVAFPTFTIRLRTIGGGRTEFQKRLEEIRSADNPVSPSYLIQSYFKPPRFGHEFRMAAIAKMKDIIEVILETKEIEKSVGMKELKKIPYYQSFGGWWTDNPDERWGDVNNATFIVVPVQLIKSQGRDATWHVFDDSPVEKKKPDKEWLEKKQREREQQERLEAMNRERHYPPGLFGMDDEEFYE
jgi:hypothetical protein